jgi:hypothetical protein
LEDPNEPEPETGAESEALHDLMEVKSVTLVDNTASEPAGEGEGQEYTTLADTIVRKSKRTKSQQIRTIPANTVLLVVEEAYSDGHHRARIGPKEWVSIETPSGKILMRPGRLQVADRNAGADKVIAPTPVHATIEPVDVISVLNIGQVIMVGKTTMSLESQVRGRIDHVGQELGSWAVVFYFHGSGRCADNAEDLP